MVVAGGRAARRASLPGASSGMDARRRARGTHLTGALLDGAGRASRACGCIGPTDTARPAGDRLVRRRRRARARRRPGAGRRRRRRAGRPPLRAAAAPPVRRRRRPRARASAVYTADDEIEALLGQRSTRVPGVLRCWRRHEPRWTLYQQVILDHAKTPHGTRAWRRPRVTTVEVAPGQPDLRRRGDPAGATWRRRPTTRVVQDVSLGRAGLLRSAGLRLGAARPGRSASRPGHASTRSAARSAR